MNTKTERRVTIQAIKDHYEASDSFLQIGHLLGSSGDKREACDQIFSN